MHDSAHDPFCAVSDAGREIIELCASIEAATHRLLTLIRAFDEQALAQRHGFLTTVHWLGYYCGIGPNAAREKLRVARALANLPVIDGAFAAGALSYSKVRALTRVATSADEAAWLETARHATAQQTERIVRDQVRLQRVEEARPELALNWYTNAEGELVIKGRLPAELGALVIRALQQQMEAELPFPGDDTPVERRRARALVCLAERALCGDAGSHHSSAERYTVHVAVSSDMPAEINGIGRLPATAVQRMLCDASLVGHVHDGDGAVLAVGRKTRVVAPALRRALRRALIRRDGGCRYPGCSHHRFVDAHHVRHWANGGATTLSNLVLLCRRHHRMVHEGSARIEVCKSEGGESFRFYDHAGVYLPPTGERVADCVRPLDVTAVTSVETSPLKPMYATARPDYGHIAWVLAQRVQRE